MKKLVLFGLATWGFTMGIIAFTFVASFFTPKADATSVPKITWCHCEPNSNCQTLELPSAALQNAGHMDANGNPLHAGDHAGQCVEPTATPTATPTVTPTATPTPEDRDCEECEPTPTPTATPTPTPEPTIPNNTQVGCRDNCGGTPPSIPVCTIPIDAPLLQGFDVTSATSVMWHWWASKSPISKQWIEYGYADGNFPYSVFVPTSATGFEIGALAPNLPRWARVGVMNDSGCVAYSNSLDP